MKLEVVIPSHSQAILHINKNKSFPKPPLGQWKVDLLAIRKNRRKHFVCTKTLLFVSIQHLEKRFLLGQKYLGLSICNITLHMMYSYFH